MRPYDALCVDPGGTTGYAIVDVGRKHIAAGQLVGHEWEQVDAILRLWLAGKARMSTNVPPFAVDAPPALVTEDFNLRTDLHEGAKSKRETLSPVRINARLDYTVYRLAMRGEVPRSWASDKAIVVQSSSDAKRYATDERLRRWGLYVPGDHARDAVRHACMWIGRAVHVDVTEGWHAERIR